MASAFGLSELRTKLDDWRSGWKLTAPRRSGKKNKSQGEPNAPASDTAKASQDVSGLVEDLVLPRLAAGLGQSVGRLSGQYADELIGTSKKRPISVEDIDGFAKLAVDGEASDLLDFVDHCLATGNNVQSVYINLLAPAARKLGAGWEEDSRDFVDVTMGLWRIQEVLRELSLRVPPPELPNRGSRSALFSTMPGEQHSLGTLMVGECFQRNGWDVEILIEPTQQELNEKLANNSFDLVGLTISCDCPTDIIKGLVTAIRAVSSNPRIRVMLGGRVLNEQPELVGICGADDTAVDASMALKAAEELVPLKAEPHVNLP